MRILLIALLLGSVFFHTDDSIADTSVVGIPGTTFEQHQITDKSGRQLTYYLSHGAAPAPLLLMIQGSGCGSVMHVQGNGSYSTLFDLLPFGKEGQFTVMAVEKPYSGDSSGQRPGSAESCSAQFNHDFTADSWLLALQTSVRDARKLEWIAKGRTLVVGLSEGAVMATLLAGHDATITDVVSIGGSGTTQLFDFIVHAYRMCFDASPCLADVEEKVRAINADPANSTSFAWGHPYKRWSSFFHVDPGEELLRSNARVYMAFGTADQSVPALSQEVAVAKLMAAGRDLTVRRVPDANHSLTDPEAPNINDLDKELRLALQWFWKHP